MRILSDFLSPAFFSGIGSFIFDCDGVLIDSYQANIWWYDRIREHFSLPPMSAAERDFVHAHTMDESIRHITPGELHDEALALNKALDYADVVPRLTPMPGMHRLVRWLGAAGFPLAVNTSRTDTIDMVLAHLGLTEAFHPVISSTKVWRPKPDPQGVREILLAHGVEAERAVYVGDSRVDALTAQAAGVRFWAYGREHPEAELFIDDFEALTTALAKARKSGWI